MVSGSPGLQEGLLDIHPPPAPPTELPWPLLPAGLLLLAIILSLLWRHYRHPRRRARRQLLRLRRECASGTMDPRNGAHRLAAILRPALAASTTDAPARSAFQVRLNAARFAAEPCNQATLAQLLDESGKWLEAQR